MNRIRTMLSTGKVLIGMIHLRPLPGTPAHQCTMSEILETALSEAAIYESAGVRALLIENMADLPYTCGDAGAEIVAAMATVGTHVRHNTKADTAIGVQVLAAGNRQALAVARAADLDFVRVEGFVYGHVADEGYIDACAGGLMRYRRYIGADNVSVWADVKKKHASHAMTADVDCAEVAAEAETNGAAAVIVTGRRTADAPCREEVAAVAARLRGGIPVVLGSGVTARNLAAYWPAANAFIVGSDFKRGGEWRGQLDRDRIRLFMDQFDALLRASK